MPIPTSRTKEAGQITIDLENCNGCGLCVEVCKDFNLILKDEKVDFSGSPLFGCVGCGHCMAMCTTGAIKVKGRFTSPDDLFDLPPMEDMASYKSLLNLFQRRRSIREFKDKPVEQEFIDKVMEAAVTAPMGIPPSDVSVMILPNKDKVFLFSKDYADSLNSMKWMVSRFGLFFVRFFYGKENHLMFRDFIRPLIKFYTETMKQGKNYVMYDAPVALYFYGSPYTDPADPLIAATYAMTAAESLGLGTCMLGGIHPFIQNGKAARRLREKWGIRSRSREGLFLIMGYPAVKYKHGIKRTFANVDCLS